MPLNQKSAKNNVFKCTLFHENCTRQPRNTDKAH
nr:MAG TPA: hypothetical protein [Caudoviricetes sp.]